MSWPPSPAWLLELQERFGGMLRTPLDRASGTLAADSSRYDPLLVAASRANDAFSSAERLTTYHRQYWFRLFTVLHGLYPLSARLVGYWRFNAFAAEHLLENPPQGFDIEAVGEGFVESLSRQLPQAATIVTTAGARIESAALLEAARVDAAFGRVIRAPQVAPFRPGAQDAARLGASRLELSPGAALLRETWALCERRMSFVDQPSDDAVELGSALPVPRHWLLLRHDSKLGLMALEAAEARLLRLLQELPVERALGELEAAVPEDERSQLPERARAWLARSVRVGVWSGLVDA